MQLDHRSSRTARPSSATGRSLVQHWTRTRARLYHRSSVPTRRFHALERDCKEKREFVPLIEHVLLHPHTALSPLTLLDYFALWAQASIDWQWTLQTESIDLTALRDSGTKSLTWHGITDDIIPHESTVEYRKRVQRSMGGADEADKLYRLFLAPGVGHCGLGRGPMPTDPLAALADWSRRARHTRFLMLPLSTKVVKQSRGSSVIKWPAKLVYMGVGDPKTASSWTCSDIANKSNRV
jgi:hypothetical protein